MLDCLSWWIMSRKLAVDGEKVKGRKEHSFCGFFSKKWLIFDRFEMEASRKINTNIKQKKGLIQEWIT